MNCIELLSLLRFLTIQSVALAQIYDDYLGAVLTQGVIVAPSSNANVTAEQSTIDGSGLAIGLTEASQFLSNATLGADYVGVI